jgi:hypothetical protein
MGGVFFKGFESVRGEFSDFIIWVMFSLLLFIKIRQKLFIHYRKKDPGCNTVKSVFLGTRDSIYGTLLYDGL